VLPDELVLVTDGRYAEQAADQLAAAGVEATLEITRDPRPVLQPKTRQTARLGLEAADVTWAQQREMRADWFPKTELVATADLVETLRQVKDDGEIARIAAAAATADAALAATTPRLTDGPTEREIALELEVEMRRRGAEGVAFETIVGSGPNGARPHARAGDRRLAEGDLVVIDFGAIIDGYRSDMTRTFSLGEPSAPQARMLDVVAASQQAGLAATSAGTPTKAVDAACRAVIDEAGWGDAFVHGTGHGVGLDIHEAPAVSSRAGGTLATGNVVTVEPGVYLPEHGGVRIEDTVVVTGAGCQPLTHAPKDPILR
jgi:Xaa-Pro aminopeptidase